MTDASLTMRTEGSLLRRSLVVMAYLAGYVALDWISYVAPISPFAITPWNPPPGLSIAFLILCGMRYWPALFVAAVLADALVRGLPGNIWLVLLNACVMTSGYAGAAAFLLQKFGKDGQITTMRHVGWLVAAAGLATLPIAASYVAVLTTAGLLPRADFDVNMAIFWVGDVIGVVITTPLLLIVRRMLDGPFDEKAPSWTEMSVQVACTAGALWLVFGISVTDEFKFFYLLFLPLIWIAMRAGIRGAVIATFAIQLGVILAVKQGGHHSVTVLELQALMLTLAITGLFLGIAVSQHRDAVTALRGKSEELSQALRLAAASEMSSALAHELNQPLAAVSHLSWASRKMLDDPRMDRAELADALDKTVTEARRAGNVVHRLRDLYKLGSVRLERVDAGSLVHSALEPLSARLARHNVMLRVQVPRPAPAIDVDPIQISAVLHNLASNAIDATSGYAAAEARRALVQVAVAADGGTITFTVDDNGPGVAPELRASLFKSVRTTTKLEGLGLGLAISRSIVEAHDGRIWLEESALGGARFCFNLPVRPT